MKKLLESYLREAEKYFTHPSFLMLEGELVLRAFLRDQRIFIKEFTDEDLANPVKNLSDRFKEVDDLVEEYHMWMMCEIDENDYAGFIHHHQEIKP